MIKSKLKFFIETDSILIKKRDIAKMNRFISKDYRCAKIEGRWNKGDVIVSQSKLRLRDDDSIQIRNMEGYKSKILAINLCIFYFSHFSHFLFFLV
jgi:hypothetical protein